MVHGPDMTWDQAKATVDAKPAPKVTEASIAARIARISYLRLETTTLCTIQMVNGFRFYGTSTPASPENYDQDVGQRYAYDNAFRQIWTHEGYLLRETLSAAAPKSHDFAP